MSVFAKIKAEISAVIASLEGDFSKLEEKLHLKVDEVAEDHKESVVVKPTAINSNAAGAVPVAPATDATATAADDQSSAETEAEPKAEDEEAPAADSDSGANKAAE